LHRAASMSLKCHEQTSSPNDSDRVSAVTLIPDSHQPADKSKF
jgi:hypothetical protein